MSSLALIGVVAVPAANETVSAETVISQLGQDIDGEAADDRSGYSVALSSDGSRVAIGAFNNDGVGENAGHVRIYDYDGTSWTQVGADIDGEAANDNSGWSVALSSDGSRVAIGASNNDGGGPNVGHVRIYDLDGGTWTQVGSDIDGEAADDRFGFSVALSSDGSRVAIGATLNDDVGENAGHVRIYDYDGVVGDGDNINKWTQVGSDIDGEAATDETGRSVSLSSDGSRVAIGAIYNDGGGDGAGHVRIYDYDGVVDDEDEIDKWTQVGSDIDGEAAGDRFGRSVALSSDGSRVAIGATNNAGNGSMAGHVRIYDYDGVHGDEDQIDKWTQVGDDINGEAENDESGRSVALSSDGSRVAIGANRNDGNGDLAGHVRIYDLDGGTWTQVGSDIDGESAGDQSGLSVALSSDGSRVAIGAYQNNNDVGSDAGHVRLFSTVQSSAPSSPTPYSGPLLTSRASAEAGSEASFTGLRLETVSSATVGDIDLPVISATSDSLVLSIPTSLLPGVYDVRIRSSLGTLSYLDGLQILETEPGSMELPTNPNVAHLAGQGPNDGEFSAWTKQMANGEQIKFYAKYLQPGQKVQFMVQNSAGSSVQYAWKRVETEDLNSDGSYSNMQNHIYFIRTLDLKPGKNRVRILVDGDIVWGTKTYVP